MKDFDEARRERAARDRSFTIGGEQFRMRSGVRPEAFASYDDMDESTPPLAALQTIDEVIVSLIEPADDAEARYRALRARDDDPLTLEDLTELVDWLVEEQTGRPTGQRSPSTDGRGANGTDSTDGSSSPAEAAATA